jgi:RNA polymerase sigma factor (TIGR02999 family)
MPHRREQGMNAAPQKPVTALLRAWGGGDEAARDQLLPLIYAELRSRAACRLRRERHGHTLQPTALVHEAYLRLVGQEVAWKNRAHFFALASEMMRRILVDHARGRNRDKRAGGWTRVELDDAVAMAEQRDVDLVLLDQALAELTVLDPQQGRIVELRFFGGMTLEETAQVLGVSPATVTRDWTLARAWLYRRLKRGAESTPPPSGAG